jgi:hypothetical protein
MTGVEKPAIDEVQLDNIPEGLRSVDRWFLWRYTMSNKGKWQKMPTKCGKFLRNGQSTNGDGGTFTSFEEATKWLSYHNDNGDNVGLALGLGIKGEDGNWLGIDLDGCFYDDGQIAPWAVRILDAIGSIAYVEISPSGQGLKATMNGSKPEGMIGCVRKFEGTKRQVEVYDKDRFWTVTGDIWGDDKFGPYNQTKVKAALDSVGFFTDPNAKTPAPTKRELNPEKVYTRKDRGQRDVWRYLDACEGSGKGNRNTSLFKVAGNIKVKFKMTDKEVEDSILLYNQQKMSPPYEDIEALRKSIRSSLNTCHERIEDNTRDDQLIEVVDVNEVKYDIDSIVKKSWQNQKMSLTEDDLRVGGLIEEIMENYQNTSKDWLPELAFASALNTVATAMAGRVEIKDNGAVPCTFSVGLAPSGAGKDFGRKLTEEILFRAGMVDRIGPEGVSSAEGFIKILEKQPNVLFQLDEAGELFGDMADTKSHMKRFGKALKEAFSKAGSRFWKPNARADAANNIVISNPNAIVYCTTTPERFWSSFSDESVQDGLMGRLLVFENAKYDKRLSRRYRKPAPTESIVQKVKSWQGDGNLPDGVAVRERMEWELTDAAYEAFVEVDNQIRLKNNAGGIADALWARLPDKAHILALIIAGSRQGPQEYGVIDREDMEKALRIIKKMTRRAIDRCSKEVSVNKVDSNRKRLLKAIQKKGRVERGKISVISQWTSKNERDSLIAELVESNQVELIEDKDSGKQYYRAV